jgi:arylsulfatase A-like enzyme
MTYQATRRDILKTLTAGGLVAGLPGAVAADGKRPDIVVVMVDDMGFSDIGCYGGEIETPNLDALAANGVRFTQFYNTARCCPSRASLLTGLYSHQAGIGHMVGDKGHDGYRGDLNQKCATFGELLRPAGYRTHLSGKWHVTKHTSPKGPNSGWPRQRGFDRYFGTLNGAGSFWTPATLTRDNEPIQPTGDDFYYTDAISSHAAGFIRDHHAETPDNPLFMYVAYTAPHWPLHAPAKTVAKYRGRYRQGWDAIRATRHERQKKLGIIDPAWQLTERDPSGSDWAALPPEKRDEMDHRMAVYAAQVDHMDQGIGHIVSALRKTGRFGNTLILFLADNGGCAEGGPLGFERKKGGTLGEDSSFASYGLSWANASNTPFRRYKHWVHEGGISSPLIAHWPERIRAKGELRRTPAHIIDIVPTCLAAAGATYPAQLGEHVLTPCEGKSLLPVFADDALPDRPLFWEHEGNRAVRVGDWKLVAKGKTGPWELYDLKADRTETNDLATKNPDRATAMAARWQAWAERCNVLPLCPKKPRGKGSKAKRFTLKQGQDLPAGKSPYVKRRPLRIKAELVDIPVNGTILAQGGSRAGYAMYVKDGCLAFTLRSKKGNGTVKAKIPLPKTATVELLLAKDASVRLSADGKEIAYGRVPELLYDMPTEGLQVGFDSGAAIGEYQGENRFTGKIRSLTLELDPK